MNNKENDAKMTTSLRVNIEWKRWYKERTNVFYMLCLI